MSDGFAGRGWRDPACSDACHCTDWHPAKPVARTKRMRSQYDEGFAMGDAYFLLDSMAQIGSLSLDGCWKCVKHFSEKSLQGSKEHSDLHFMQIHSFVYNQWSE